jgi:glycosyltransferase involved in cell wall biosynthesis
MTAPHSKAFSGTRPFFSIVTAVYNGAKTLETAIESLRRQTFRDFEYLVLDGGSTDGTVQLLEKYGSEIAYWKSERDSGIYDAWNKAVCQARGEWIAFLGADDVYCVDALAQYAAIIASQGQKNLQYVSSRVRLLKNGRAVRTIGAAWSWPAFSHHMTVAHVGSMHHRSLFEEYGRFDQSYRLCADYEFLLRPRGRLRSAFLDHVTAEMAMGGVSNANVRSALAEQERAKRTTGGRPAWLCAFERRKAHVKDICRGLLWY